MFTLGTAQLGMLYGVANKSGGPSLRQAQEILRSALALGVSALDTAPDYGMAEEWIGQFSDRARFSITTKLPKLPDGITRTDLSKFVETALEGSCTRLRIEMIDQYLLHAADDLNRFGSELVEVLANLVERGRVKKIGVSVYEPSQADMVRAYDAFSVLQFPFNVFDRSISASVDSVAWRGFVLCARSVLLQGLLLLDPDEAPVGEACLRRFSELSRRFDLAPLRAALGYAKHRSGASSLIIGVDSSEQLREIARALAAPFPMALADEIERVFSDVPAEVFDPRRWKPVVS